MVTIDSLPSLEPVALALHTYIAANAAAVLQQVSDAFGDPVIPLAVPRYYQRDTGLSVETVRGFPTLVTLTRNLRVVRGAEQGAAAMGWAGEMNVLWWAEDSDPERLGIALNRYGAALRVLIAGADPIGGYAAVDWDTFVLEFSEPGSVAARAAGCGFDLLFIE